MAINTSTLGDLLKHRYSADFIREMQGQFAQYADLGDWVVQVYVSEMRVGSIWHRCRGEEYEHVKNPVGRIPKTGVERCETNGDASGGTAWRLRWQPEGIVRDGRWRSSSPSLRRLAQTRYSSSYGQTVA